MEVLYQDIVKNGNQTLKADARTRMARYALEHGVVAAARAFGVNRETARKWKERFKNGESMEDMSTRPRRSPREMDPKCRDLIIEKAREELDRLMKNRARNIRKSIKIAATWLKRKYGVPYGVPAILRVLREAGLKERNPQAKRRSPSGEILERKRLLKPFKLIAVDFKHMNDIHGYAGYLADPALKLPKYQITARDTRTGACFSGYASQKSATHAALFIDAFLSHLRRLGIDVSRVVVQTDNGREFTNAFGDGHASAFTVIVCLKHGARHTLIPPGQKNWQSDVESFNRLVEDEFLQPLPRPASRREFLEMARAYHNWFNHARPNSYKGAPPLSILRDADPTIDEAVLRWGPFDCDRAMTRERLDEQATWYRKARETRFYEKARVETRMPFILPKKREIAKSGVAQYWDTG